MVSRASHHFSESAPARQLDAERRTDTLVPKHCTLDGFADETSRSDGIDIRKAEPLTPLLVRTENSVYRVTPLQSGNTRVMIQGGIYFPEPTEAHLAGATFGGSFLKMAWIGVGLCMEICAGGRRIVTSRVRRIGAVASTHAMA